MQPKVERIDNQSTTVGSRLDSELDAQDLERLKLAADEAEFFAHAIDRGDTLLIVSCDEERSEEVRKLLKPFDLDELPTSDRLHRIRFQEKALAGGETIDEGGFHRSEQTRQKLHQADSEYLIGDRETGDASGLSRRAHAQDRASGESATEQGQASSAALDRFRRFDNAFRQHFEENFKDTGLPYAEYSRAYRFGMVLAEHGGFRDREWETVERFARQGWDTQTHGQWDLFGEAVHFGWDVMRGNETQPRLRL